MKSRRYHTVLLVFLALTPWLRYGVFADGGFVSTESVAVSADQRAIIIKNGDLIDVYNDRGRVRILARVTPRIMPGVVSIGQGAWYNPDKNGVDHGGCANVLTRGEHSPGGAYCSNTALVQIERI